MECGLYVIACLLCAVLEIFVFSNIEINDKRWKTIFIIVQIAFSLSPVLFVWGTKKLFKKPLLKFAGIPNLEGNYQVQLSSNYNGGTYTQASVEIKQSFNTISLCFRTEKSYSTPDSCHIDNSKNYPELIYTYHNNGNGADENNKTHMGTAVLTFLNDKVNGFYYNNGKDRNTYGTIAS